MTDEFIKVADGAYCEVWFSKKVLKVFKKAPRKNQARTFKILDHLSKFGSDDLHEQQYKAEERLLNSAGKYVMVYATKADQLRVYGCWAGGCPSKFICAEAAIKKTKKADRTKLERAAKCLGE
ncbi:MULTISPECIES: hypothetical protein [Rhodobacterales]|uniref:hypothetical protein n=1 Tax=Rhodobacterales TaxID=204455 RepID=UPI0011BE94A3|nr:MULTISPECIES: hypothetical protein [Rhodobacterales]MDO6591826.1 hypothetical protein [Yoonia sp. 1_MG-2023]